MAMLDVKMTNSDQVPLNIANINWLNTGKRNEQLGEDSNELPKMLEKRDMSKMCKKRMKSVKIQR